MMTAKMMEALKNAGIAKEWHKGDMHRLYIEVSAADDLYYANSDSLQHGRLCVNRYERNNGKIWVDMETGEINTKNISSIDDVISQIMELVAYMMPAEENKAEENEEAAEKTGRKEEENMESKKVWYAVMKDNEDTDHGYGSHDLEKAIEMANKMRKSGDEEAYIAVIDPDDDYCIEEIRDF